MSFAEKSITLKEDLTLKYWDEGSGDPILMLHGFGGAKLDWSLTIPDLLPHYRIIAMDYPGHGVSDRARDRGIASIPSMAALIQDLADCLDISSPPIVMAHSVGGMIALKLALTYPISKLILISPAGLGPKVGLKYRLASVFPLGELLFSRPVLSLARHLAKADTISKLSDELVDRRYDYLLIPGTRQGILYALRTEMTWRGLRQPLTETELRTITIPTLVLWGVDDRTVPPEYAETAVQSLPCCDAYVLNNARHSAHHERVKTVNDLILSFLQSDQVAGKLSTVD